MDFSKTPSQDSREAYETLARLYVKYCEPRDSVEGISMMMRSGMDIDALESILMETGTHIFTARKKSEQKYIKSAGEAVQIQSSIEKNKMVLGLTPEHKGTLKKKYGLLEIKAMQADTFRRNKAAFEQADLDCDDFELACLSLPETKTKTGRVLFLDGYYDDADDTKTERCIGQIIMTILHERSPYVEKNMQEAIDIQAAENAYGLT